MLAMQNMTEPQKKQQQQQQTKKEISNRYLREHHQKTCVMLSRFLAVKGLRWFEGISVTKGKLVTKICFSENVA